MKKVSNSPYLPNAGRAYTTFDGALKFDQDLTKSLRDLFIEFASRLNETLPKDGSEPMTGDLDLGGNDITNVATFTTTGNVTVGGDLSVGDDLTVTDDASVGGDLVVTGSVTASSFIGLPASAAAVFNGDIFGLTLSNNVTDPTNDIDIAPGHAASDDATPFKITLASVLTKRLDAAWAVGTNQGGLDTGAIANTTYFVWLIRRPDTGVVDALLSASPTSPTMPANYTQKRYIGPIVRSGGTIQAFKQENDFFEWVTQSVDVNAVTNGVSTLRTLRVPIGKVVRAKFVVRIANTAGAVSGVNHWNPALGSTLPNNYTGYLHMFVNSAVSQAFSENFEILTNASGQIYNRANGASFTSYEIVTEGWWDSRGRYS